MRCRARTVRASARSRVAEIPQWRTLGGKTAGKHLELMEHFGFANNWRVQAADHFKQMRVGGFVVPGRESVRDGVVIVDKRQLPHTRAPHDGVRPERRDVRRLLNHAEPDHKVDLTKRD